MTAVTGDGNKAVYPSLSCRPVFISGGATGIGEALVRAFAAQGARVGFVDLAEAEGDAFAAELNGQGGQVLFRRCDVTDIDGYRAAIADIEAALRDSRKAEAP